MLFAALHWGSLLGFFLRRHYWQVDLFWALGIICALHGLGVDGLGVNRLVSQAVRRPFRFREPRVIRARAGARVAARRASCDEFLT